MADTAPKPFVFVLMPFDSEFADAYELGIKPACEDAGAHPERVDEQIFQSSIITRIYNNIAKADIIVADMSGRNPNVFYEVGYAHALNKLVILLTKDAKDIPFDLKDYPHIVYNSIVDLKAALTTRVQWFVNNPSESSKLAQTNIELYVNQISLENHPTITYFPNRGVHSLEIHNPTSRRFAEKSIQVGLIIRSGIFGSENYFPKAIPLPDEGVLYLFPDVGALFPQGWETLEFRLKFFDNFDSSSVTEMVFRVFTEVTYIDFPVSVNLDFS